MICFVFKPSRKRASRKAPLYYGRYRLKEGDKLVTVPLRTTDERVARKRLDAIVVQKQREEVGLAIPAPILKTATTPILDLLDAYTKDLHARGCAHMYVYTIERLATRLCQECGWTRITDVSVDRFTTWRNTKGTNKAAKTLNQYQDAITGLLRWLVSQGLMESNPLAGMRKAITAGAERRRRRALTDDELRKLLAVSTRRRTVYLTAALTGLRRNELASLVWADVHLDDPNPHILARASTTKNHRDARQPLHPDLVEALRAHRPADAEPDTPVFHAIPDMTTLRKDLKAAGIPYKDHGGRQADFHSLRYTLATRMMNAGVHPRVAMQIMRHSEMRLTAKIYTDANQLPTDAAVLSLPSLGEKCSQLCSQQEVISGPNVSRADTTTAAAAAPKAPEIKGFRQG